MLEFGDALIFLGNSTSGMLVCLLPLLMLGFVGTTRLALTVKEIREFFRFKTVAFKESVTIAQEILFL